MNQRRTYDEQLIAPLYLIRIFAHPAFSSLAQKTVITGAPGKSGLYGGFVT